MFETSEAGPSNWYNKAHNDHELGYSSNGMNMTSQFQRCSTPSPSSPVYPQTPSLKRRREPNEEDDHYQPSNLDSGSRLSTTPTATNAVYDHPRPRKRLRYHSGTSDIQKYPGLDLSEPYNGKHAGIVEQETLELVQPNTGGSARGPYNIRIPDLNTVPLLNPRSVQYQSSPENTHTTLALPAQIQFTQPLQHTPEKAQVASPSPRMIQKQPQREIIKSNVKIISSSEDDDNGDVSNTHAEDGKAPFLPAKIDKGKGKAVVDVVDSQRRAVEFLEPRNTSSTMEKTLVVAPTSPGKKRRERKRSQNPFVPSACHESVTLEQLKPYCPKLLALISSLPETDAKIAREGLVEFYCNMTPNAFNQGFIAGWTSVLAKLGKSMKHQ